MIPPDADPGVQNWLDTRGFTDSSHIVRFLLSAAKPEPPRTEVRS